MIGMNTFVDELKKQHDTLMLKQKKQAGIRRQQNKKKDEGLQLYNPFYTDAPKYAKEYYGEVMHYTTKWDNEWD